mgnify:CR=1 FL=1
MNNIVLNNKLRTSPQGIELVDNALKVANSFNNTKKCLENEIESLKSQLAMTDVKYSGTHQFYNQGCFWMAGKSLEEVESLDKDIQGLYAEFEERVKHDRIKRKYCLDNKIRLIEIKYTDDLESCLKNIFYLK